MDDPGQEGVREGSVSVQGAHHDHHDGEDHRGEYEEYDEPSGFAGQVHLTGLYKSRDIIQISIRHRPSSYC